MVIQERSYGGKLFRPTPEIYTSDDQNLLIIASPWGNPQAAREFIEIVSTQYRASVEDLDKTSIGHLSDHFSREENRLRMSMLAAHEDIKEKYNDDTLSAGLEVLCCLKIENKVSWFVVGAPFIALRRGEKLLPLHHPVDLSFDFSKDKTLPPLPKDLLGFQAQLNIEHGSFRREAGDQLLLINRSYVPHDVFTIPVAELNIENATLAMAKENENQPFWIGTLDF